MPLSSTTAVCSLALLMVAVITNCVAGCVWWVPVVTPSRRRGRDQSSIPQYRMSHAATTGCANCTATSARFHSRLQRFCASVGHPACMAALAKHYLLMKSAKPGVGHPGDPGSSQQQGRRLFPGLKIAVRAGGPCRARWSRQRFALHKMCCIPQSVRAAAQRTARWLG